MVHHLKGPLKGHITEAIDRKKARQSVGFEPTPSRLVIYSAVTFMDMNLG